MGAASSMAIRAGFPCGPLSFAIEAGVLRAWLLGAEPGDEIVYATGPVVPKSADVVLLVRELTEEGLLRTHQRRAGKTFEYFAVKRVPHADPLPPIRHPLPRGDDDADARVLRMLCRAANFAQVCPTNVELAQACGLPDAFAASYRVRKLINAGAIRVEDQGPKMRRIVTILASGQRTVAGVL